MMKIASGMRMTAATILRSTLPAGRGSTWVRAIKPLAHFLAGLEERHAFLVDGDMGAGARIAAGARRALLHRERAEAAQLDPVAARHRRDDLVENGVDDVLHVALVEVRILRGDMLNQFRLDHIRPPSVARERCLGQFAAAGCQRANRPSRLNRSTSATMPQSSSRRASVVSPVASSRATTEACRNGRSLKRPRSS